MTHIKYKLNLISNLYARGLFLFLAILVMCLPALSIAGTVNLPETGQTTSYATGDDGDIQAGVAWPSPRFTNNGDSTITDNLTGLMWTQDANLPAGTKTWQEALNYVAGLNAGSYQGYTDWRLPNINELESLVNAEESNSATWLNSQAFTNVQSIYYWSSTRSNSAMWLVDMSVGNVSYPMTTVGYVWPVRSGSGGSFDNSEIWETGQNVSYATGDDGDIKAGVAWPTPRFTDNGDGTVTDNLTGLVWTQDANLPAGTKTWQQALDYVKGMNAGTYPNLGYTDWRLPNRKGLFSLIDRSQYNPPIQSGHPFTNVQSNFYWGAGQ